MTKTVVIVENNLMKNPHTHMHTHTGQTLDKYSIPVCRNELTQYRNFKLDDLIQIQYTKQ